MNLHEAMDVRRSRRAYLPIPLSAEAVATLQETIAGLVSRSGERIELVLDNGEAFAHLNKTYGMFTGVRHYAGLIARRDDPVSAEKLGYFGESLALTAVMMGLGTCWVGGSFDRDACPFTLSSDEMIACVLVVGNVEQRESFKEQTIRRTIHRHSKSIEQMVAATASPPAWFTNGMRAVQKAPSAVNRQPVTFRFDHGLVTATIPKPDESMMAVDFGIAKFHFEIGAGGGRWAWGNGAAFTHRDA